MTKRKEYIPTNWSPAYVNVICCVDMKKTNIGDLNIFCANTQLSLVKQFQYDMDADVCCLECQSSMSWDFPVFLFHTLFCPILFIVNQSGWAT